LGAGARSKYRRTKRGADILSKWTKVKSHFCVGPSWKEARTEGIKDAKGVAIVSAHSYRGEAVVTRNAWYKPITIDIREGSSILMLQPY